MKRILSLCTVILALVTGFTPASARISVEADTFTVAIQHRLDSLVANDIFERTQLGLYVYDITADRPLYDRGRRQCMRPASCMKVITAVTALNTLGGDYCYTTRLYRTDSTHIAIRGGMDPMFGPDDLRAFTRTLRDSAITHIDGPILLDNTLKDTDTLGWGWCWDDEATPLTPFLYSGRATFESHLRQALSDAGIAFDGQYAYKALPSGARLIATRTHSIDQILQPMMKKSNNLYAETLFYQLAAHSRHPYASYKDAAREVGSLIDLTNHVIDHYQVADGSGLSLYNYVTPELLVDVLRYAYAHQDIYTHLLPSLPIMGRDGTLRRRCIGTSAQDRVYAKTGTVTGVSSLSGYATAPNGHLLAFAIINQGIRNTSTGRNFQDRICIALTQPLGIDTIEPDTIATPADDECDDEE